MKKTLLILTGNFLMRTKFLFFLLLPILLHAERLCERPSRLSLGVGTFDTLRPKERMLQFQIEYQWSSSWHGIQPIMNLMVTEKGSVYFCIGAIYDIFLGPYLVLSPSFAPGIYSKNGGKELGFPLEFRSSIALAAQLRNYDRLGIQFYHISNAKLGFKNPGEESLVIFYSFSI